MYRKIDSVSINGLEGYRIDVEIDISNGMPNFNIVGLADTAIQESKERVRTAIKNSGYKFPPTRITINLAPADIRKRGPSFDLAIAIGILSIDFDFSEEFINNSLFLGELALNGNIRGISSVLPSVIFAKEQSYKYIFLPEENIKEASLIPNIKIIGIEKLKNLIDILLGIEKPIIHENLHFKSYSREVENFDVYDFSMIIGQNHAKRALLIAACGGHNILMEGPPGSGKTMLAKSISSILPPMGLNETIETSKIYSVAGLLSKDKPLITRRPFRRIHHTASAISIIGGGKDSRPGEISLAHKGVLFLDEFLEFDSHLLETLRQPMEDGEITINRVNATYKYPAKFMLVGALNPCPCGFYGDNEKTCTCSQFNIDRYRKKLSGPILDRIDIYINVPRLKIEEFNKKISENSGSIEMQKVVLNSRNFQLKRFEGSLKTYNSEMDNMDVEKYCKLGAEEDIFLKNAIERLELSTRVYFRTLKLARTIADIGESENIKMEHLAEALSYRGQ